MPNLATIKAVTPPATHPAPRAAESRVVAGVGDTALPSMEEWVEAECIRLDDEARARLRLTNPQLADAEDRLERAFGRGTPGTPFMRVMLKMEYARRFKGAKVIVADGFAEVALHGAAMKAEVRL